MLTAFPRTLLLAGTTDPLYESTQLAGSFLRAAGVDVEYEEYESGHGFLGFPPQWTFGHWTCACAPATERIVRFVAGKRVTYPRAPLPVDKSTLTIGLMSLLPGLVGAIYCLYTFWTCVMGRDLIEG